MQLPSLIDFFGNCVNIVSVDNLPSPFEKGAEGNFEEGFELIRSFLAIELPGHIVKKIEEVQKDLKSSRADVRWVSPEKIHLTLKFFGDIEEARIESIIKAIEDPVRKTPPFSLLVRGMGAFPQLKNPRVIWMGLVDPKGALAPFQKEVEVKLNEIGFRSRRPCFPTPPDAWEGKIEPGKGRTGRDGGEAYGRRVRRICGRQGHSF